jgi:anaphase-promoting complex subunit 7
MEKLWSCGLTESINIVSNIELHCQSANDPILSLVTALHFADSLSEHHRYVEAVGHYQMILQQMKSANMREISTQMEKKGLNEMDIRIKLAMCQYRMKNCQMALEMLENILYQEGCPVKAMAFAASLYHKLGQNRLAAKHYKDVVRKCPLALEAINGLLRIGVKAVEIISLIPYDLQSQHFWLPVWIKAGELLEQYQFASAVTVLQSLPEKSFESSELLAQLAYSQWMAGKLDIAKRSFQKARSVNPHIIRHMDSYAHLLFMDENKQELENIATSLQQSSQDHCESWIALAYLSFTVDKKSRALYFSEKAVSLSEANVEANVEAVILKGFLLRKFNKSQQAIVQYQEAVKISPGHFYANEGLVQCLLDCHRYRSAELVAQSMLRAVGQSGRAFMVVF